MAEHDRKTELVNRIALRDALYCADAVTMEGVKIINQFPSVAAVEVVRCKYCKHSYINSFSAASGVALCLLLTKRAEGIKFVMQQDDFCSYGERKERKARKSNG